MLNALVRRWPAAAWHAGRLGLIVRIHGCSIEMPSRYMAGEARLCGYEGVECAAVERFLPPSFPVLDLGAGIGVVSCVANRKLRHPDMHIAVDGNPDAIRRAAGNGMRNGCSFQTRHAALAYDVSSVTFGCDDHILGGGIDTDHKKIEVPATTLTNLFRETGWAAASVICDIEGAEAPMIGREGDVIAARVPLLIAELHPTVYGADVAARLNKELSALGLERVWERNTVGVWRNTAFSTR